MFQTAMINSGKLAGKTILVTGASRGIGQAIAEKCAKDGANIVVAAKTAQPHAKLPGTIHSVAERINALGGKSLACVVDVRDESNVQSAVEQAVKTFGGIDILVNNASAISLTGTEITTMKKYDLMHQVNVRGTYMMTQKCLPYLRQAKNPHILNISPPLIMKSIWFQNHVAYTMSKYGMSMCVLGMAEEFRDARIAVNALWPKTAIATAAVEMLGGESMVNQSRKPDIMADAAYVILGKDSGSYSGNFAVDEEVLVDVGVKDFDQYAHKPGAKLIPDFFLDSPEAEALVHKHERNMKQGSKSPSSSGDASSLTDTPESVINEMQSMISPEIVKDVGKVFLFELSGDHSGTFYLDLKHGTAGKGHPDGSSDVTMKLSGSDFVNMVRGKLNSTTAFMSGKLKIEGDMFVAMKLEKLMKKIQKSKL
ncbi:hydroxysteroid dehydrogenase-like protein 2 [Symsagittifera roscoffensis]|uniref:hydroxysteroid dehydrogenase-like protein 2 n=1 Tax=Symsagittifera roscoffensis TaxID=84072 RepID=UPI00307C52E5